MEKSWKCVFEFLWEPCNVCIEFINFDKANHVLSLVVEFCFPQIMSSWRGLVLTV